MVDDVRKLLALLLLLLLLPFSAAAQAPLIVNGYSETSTASACSLSIVAGTLTVPLQSGCTLFSLTNTASITTMEITGCTGSRSNSFVIRITSNGSSRTQSWTGSFGTALWTNGAPPTLTPTNGAIDEIMFSGLNACSQLLGHYVLNFLSP